MLFKIRYKMTKHHFPFPALPGQVPAVWTQQRVSSQPMYIYKNCDMYGGTPVETGSKIRQCAQVSESLSLSIDVLITLRHE